MSSVSQWVEVRVVAPLEWLELVGETLACDPCTTVAFGRASLATSEPPEGFDYVRTFYPLIADSPEVRARIATTLADLAEATGADELRALAVEFKALPPEDYATSWKRSWKAFRVGSIAVIAPWSDARPRASDLVMRLEPGGAFGSGRHATTRAMLRALVARGTSGKRVLDAGSGSGILSVASALLGAREVLGFDVDKHAQHFARELAQDNGVDARVRFEHGGFEVLAREPGPFDVVLANIYSDVIQLHALDLENALAPHGWFAFSGCPHHHADATRSAIAAAGLAIEAEPVRGRWHTFVGVKRR